MNVVIGGDKSLIFASGSNDVVSFRPTFWPTDIPGLSSWFSADYGVYTNSNTLAQNGGLVSLWTSRINNITLTQSTTSKQPTFLNGGVKFDGGDILGGINLSALNSPLNYYVAVDSISMNSTTTSPLAPPAPIIKQGAGAPNQGGPYGFIVDHGDILGAANPIGQVSTINVTNQKTALACIIYNNDEAIIRKGNISNETVVELGQATNASTSFFIGGYSNTYINQYMKGTIYEILVYAGTEHTFQQQNLVLQYLAQKWGLTI